MAPHPRFLARAFCHVALFSSALFGAAENASAQEQPPNASVQDEPSSAAAAPEASLGTHQRHVRLEAGVRSQFVNSAGLDPFSENDYVPQFTTGGSYVLFVRDRLSIAGSLLGDLGSSSSKARGSETFVNTYRIALGPEVRYHVLRVAAATLRLSPALIHTQAHFQDGNVGELEKNSWTFGVDATAGVAVEVYGYASGESRRARFWLIAEGGYGWSAASDLSFAPKEPANAPVRWEPLKFGELSLSGPLFRLSAAISF